MSKEYTPPLNKFIALMDSWDYTPAKVEMIYSSGFLTCHIDMGLNFEITAHASSTDGMNNLISCLQRMYEKEGMANK